MGAAAVLIAVEGIFKNGVVELLNAPPDLAEASRVVVTFLPPSPGMIDLAAHGITPQRAAEMRASFGAGAEDWDDPAMDIYNDDLQAR